MGYFLLEKEKNEIVGVSSVIEKKEDDVKYLLLEFIFIDEQYRRKNQCYELNEYITNKTDLMKKFSFTI